MRGMAVVVIVVGACSFKGNGAIDDAPPITPAIDTPIGHPDDGDVDDLDAQVAPDGFTTLTCPSGYAPLGNIVGSKYRLDNGGGGGANFYAWHSDCNDDLQGSTHLATIETKEEAAALQLAVDGTALNSRYFIGAVQKRSQVLPSDGWIDFHGVAVDPQLWAVLGGSQEPHDAQNVTELGAENLAVLTAEPAATSGYFLDVVGAKFYGAICECDGRGVAQIAQQAIDEDPNHP